MKSWLRFGMVAGSLLALGLRVHTEEPDDAPPTATLPGHSAHGTAFNEGPRQPAYLMEGMPHITFPVTTAVPRARAFFLQGVGQLHGFWDFEAERSFRQAAVEDPQLAMAYWGMAMANHNNPKRAREFIVEAETLIENAGTRERQWIKALADFHREPEKPEKDRRRAYTYALEDLIYEAPDDIEAMAFLALHLWSSQSKGWPIASALTVDILLDRIFAIDSGHPAHHYRIHLWDGQKRELATRALASAAAAGASGRGIAHLWHMSGHTYSKLYRYPDAVWQQEASVRTDNAHLIRNLILPDTIHNYAHNSEWMVSNMNYIGRVHDALDLARNMIEMPRHPNLNTLDLSAEGIPYEKLNGTSGQGRRRLLETLLRYELWEQVVAWADTVYLEPGSIAREHAQRARLLGLAHFALGHIDAGNQQIDALEAAAAKVRVERAAAVDAAEAKARAAGQDGDAQQKAMAEALQRHRQPLEQISEMIEELEVHAALARDETEDLAERIKNLKGVSKERLARLHWDIGETDRALELAAEAVNGGTNQVQLLANHADLLWRAGRTNEAYDTFNLLRERSGWIDLGMPVFQRVHPIAAALELPTDWRIAPQHSEDFGRRPDISTLGPFLWEPAPAPDWTLSQADNTPLHLSDFQGRSVLPVFYLGHGCVHCLEQLNALAPAEADFAQLGVQLVAVSADSVDALEKTQALADGGRGFPFPIAADPSREVFRKYRAFDGFEGVPMHGVFLIDPDGRIRWMDVGYEPFEDVHFLLAETERQLQLHRDQQRLARRLPGTSEENPPAASTSSFQQTPGAL